MKDCKGQDCATVDGEHSVACRYEYALARLGLTDTPQMRVLFWDANDALEWKEETDSYVVPAAIRQHDSDCSTNNRGVPELLGPCDCSVSQSKQHVVELPTMSMVLGILPADQRETAANVLMMCKLAVLESGAAVKMGAWTESVPVLDPDELTQFLEQTDFDAAEKVASEKAAELPHLPAGGEDDCEGCKI